MIPRRFKRKKIFVTDGQTNERTDGRTDRRDGRNSDLDVGSMEILPLIVSTQLSL